MVKVLQLFYILVAGMPTGLGAQTNVSADGLSVIDRRIPDESKARYLSTSLFSCVYFVRVLSDEGRREDRISMLRRILASTLGAAGSGKTLTVSKYDILFNEASSQMDAAFAVAGAATGSFGGKTTRAAPKCKKEQTERGWFDPSETTNGNPPIVIEFSGEVQGKPIMVRSVYSPAVKLSTIGMLTTSKAKKNLYDKNAAPEVEKAIEVANKQIAAGVASVVVK